MLKDKTNSNIVGVFDSEDVLLDAITAVKEKSLEIKNVFSPYPINEVFHKLGLKTRLPYAAFVFGASGTLLVFALLYWITVIDYPVVIGGKPSLSLSYVIILFVMTINLGVTLSVLAFFGLQRLYPGKKAMIVHPGAMDDKFVIVIELNKEMSESDINEISALLKNNGAVEVGQKNNIDRF